MSKWKQRVSGEPILIEPKTLRDTACCDCGLVHTNIYFLKKHRGKLWIEKVGFRNDYETEKRRKLNERNRKNKQRNKP